MDFPYLVVWTIGLGIWVIGTIIEQKSPDWRTPLGLTGSILQLVGVVCEFTSLILYWTK